MGVFIVMDGLVLSMSIFPTVNVAELPALSVADPVADWSIPSFVRTVSIGVRLRECF